MADRTFGRDAVLLADVPGSGTGPVTITLTDPLGAVVANAATATFVGGDRFSFILPAASQTLTGFYTATWVGAVRSVVQTISIDYQPTAGMTKFDARIQAAKQVSKVVYGRVTTMNDTIMTDNSLIGGSDEYVYWFVMLYPDHPDAGVVRQVIDYNGSAMLLDDTFSSPPLRGDRYVLFDIDPREIDNDLNAAVTELSPITRIPIQLTGLVLTDTSLALPSYLSHVYAVYADDRVISPLEWNPAAQRTLQFVSAPSGTVRLLGLRHAGLPNYEDSILETNGPATAALTAFRLHSARALGQALDFEEHLRRQIAMEQTAERLKRSSVTRLPKGAREVLP